MENRVTTLDDVAASIRQALDKSGQARQALALAADLLDEAIQIFASTVAGSQDTDTNQVLAFLTQARTGIDEAYRTLAAAEAQAHDYLCSITRMPTAERTSIAQPQLSRASRSYAPNYRRQSCGAAVRRRMADGLHRTDRPNQ